MAAAAEFRKIIEHPWIAQTYPRGPGALPHLALGRAYALQGDIADAGAAYQDFFDAWKDADPDIPILKQAKVELMDGRASLEEIAHKLAAEFPKRFSRWQEALSYAGVVWQEYSR